MIYIKTEFRKMQNVCCVHNIRLVHDLDLLNCLYNKNIHEIFFPVMVMSHKKYNYSFITRGLGQRFLVVPSKRVLITLYLF